MKINKSAEKQRFACPCCNSMTIGNLGTYEICAVCGWEDDPIQSADPEYIGGANANSLSQARKKWHE